MKLLLFFIFVGITAESNKGLRQVKSTSCEPVRVNLALGTTTQLIFEQEPKISLYADKKHFKIHSNNLAPRSLAIIPFIETSELDMFRDSKGQLPSDKDLAGMLDESFKTNLFVFFENNNQLLFELRFVEKNKSNYILKVQQSFQKGCVL